MESAFLIAAPTSGSGKTSLARGLMALFTQQGHRVQPFKCGPDYIDTKFHETVCHRPSINLDTFMASEEHVRELFRRYTQGGDDAPEWAHEPADVAIVEGMMGLFDGYDRYHGSCADIARVLDLPIVLVVDASSAAYSMAAILHGFIDFFPDDPMIENVSFDRIRFAGIFRAAVGKFYSAFPVDRAVHAVCVLDRNLGNDLLRFGHDRGLDGLRFGQSRFERFNFLLCAAELGLRATQFVLQFVALGNQRLRQRRKICVLLLRTSDGGAQKKQRGKQPDDNLEAGGFANHDTSPF